MRVEHTRLELTLPLAALQRVLQRSIDLVGFGLQAGEHARVVDLEIPDVFGHVTAAEGSGLDVDAARNAFRSWIVASGLRDCVEAVGPALEWARKFCFIWTRPGAIVPLEDGKFRLEANFTGADWNEHIIKGARKFDRLTLPDKFGHLATTYGWSLPGLAEHVLTLNAARNCLAHREGVVGPDDLKDENDGGLRIRWRRLQLVAVAQAGARTVQAGTRIEAGEAVQIRFVDFEKTVLLGERIDFTAQEYVEIAMTFLFFAIEVQTSAEAVQNARIPSPPAAS